MEWTGWDSLPITVIIYGPFGRKTVVPVHSNEMLGRGLINEILKQVKITREEYEKLRLKI